jgi:cobyrinic acid a,c-diamide synthase
MMITKQAVADQIGAYIRHETTLDQLVDWAERALLDGEFDPEYASDLGTVIARLGVADVRAFGLAWEDCEDLLRRLGYHARVQIVSA